jgi:hypothetical protein
MSLTAEGAVHSAKSAGTTPEFWLPWTFRRVLELPGPPLAIGAGAFALLLAVDAAWFNATGMWQGFRFEGIPIWLHPYGSVSLGYAVTLGFSVMALIYLVRGAERDVSQLGPALDLEPGSLADRRREVLSVPARSLRVGTVIALAMAVIDVSFGFVYMDLGRLGSASMAWLVTREVLCDLFVFRTFTWAIIVSLRLSRLARERVRIRLLDLSTLRPFTQNGVRLALFWLMLWAIWVPFLFLGPVEGDALLSMSAMLGAGSALSAIAVTLPTRGARRRLREAKAAQLADVRDAIEIDRGASLDPNHPDRTAAAARLQGLLAYEARVEGISESLFDAHSLRRMALYLLIPLASWVGGAMIERLMDALLD